MPLANLLKRNSKLFAAALLVALASSVVGPNPALAAAPQHHDEVPGFYRLKVGDLEVTALFDGSAVFDLHWLIGKKVTMDRVERALHEDPHLLDVGETGFLVADEEHMGAAVARLGEIDAHACRRWIAGHCDVDVVAAAYERIYRARVADAEPVVMARV
jgi:hypothetical protein